MAYDELDPARYDGDLVAGAAPIRIAQASSSETFTKYGKAPNQRRTGVTVSKPGGNMDGELNVVNFSGGWGCVYRPKDSSVAEFMATFMVSAVSNGSHIGYSQDASRVGVFDECKKMTLPNPARITKLVNCDCATLVGAAIYFAGIKLDSLRKLCTWEMEDVLMKSGQFTKLTDKDLLQSAKGIKRGDVLWRTGHTAVAIDSYVNEHEGGKSMVFPDDASKFLKENGLRTKDLDGNSWYLYSEKGTSSYTLVNDMTYLVTFCNRNAASNSNDAVAIVAVHRDASHINMLKSSSSTKFSINGLTLTVQRGCMYGRLSITRLT